MAKKTTARKTTGRRKASKRELIDTGTDKRFVLDCRQRLGDVNFAGRTPG